MNNLTNPHSEKQQSILSTPKPDVEKETKMFDISEEYSLKIIRGQSIGKLKRDAVVHNSIDSNRNPLASIISSDSSGSNSQNQLMVH